MDEIVKSALRLYEHSPVSLALSHVKANSMQACIFAASSKDSKLFSDIGPIQFEKNVIDRGLLTAMCAIFGSLSKFVMQGLNSTIIINPEKLEQALQNRPHKQVFPSFLLSFFLFSFTYNGIPEETYHLLQTEKNM